MPKNKPPQPEKPPMLASEKPDPDAESWYQYILTVKQTAPDRLENAANFLATMIATSLALFLAISGGNGDLTQHRNFGGMRIAIILWFLSLVVAFLVLFPWRYRYASDSVDSIKAAHQKIIRVKRILLVASLALFLAALGMMIVYEF